jgi:hypothetical protein
VFSKTNFLAWGKKNVVLFASVETRIDDRKNDDLWRTYGFRGFPSMALLDQTGNIQRKGFPRDFFSISNTVAAVTALAKIQKRISAGEGYDKNAWFMARLGSGELHHDKAKVELAKLQLGREEKQNAEQQILVMELKQMMSRGRGFRVSAERKAEVSEAVYKTFKSGKRLHENSHLIAQFDSFLIAAAKKNDDGVAFLYSYQRVRESKVNLVKSRNASVQRFRKSLQEYRNNEREQMARRFESAIVRMTRDVDRLEKEIAELDVLAARLGKAK